MHINCNNATGNNSFHEHLEFSSYIGRVLFNIQWILDIGYWIELVQCMSKFLFQYLNAEMQQNKPHPRKYQFINLQNVNNIYTRKVTKILPEREHAFRPCWRFHEIIRKWVSNCQSVETGCHYLGHRNNRLSYSNLIIVNFIWLQQKHTWKENCNITRYQFNQRSIWSKQA